MRRIKRWQSVQSSVSSIFGVLGSFILRPQGTKPASAQLGSKEKNKKAKTIAPNNFENWKFIIENFIIQCPRKDSNPHHRLRRPARYPLRHGGAMLKSLYQYCIRLIEKSKNQG